MSLDVVKREAAALNDDSRKLLFALLISWRERTAQYLTPSASSAARRRRVVTETQFSR